MTPPTVSTQSNCKKIESLMENGFVIVAFAIFLFAMISTLTKSGHEAGHSGGDAHVQSEAAPPAHH